MEPQVLVNWQCAISPDGRWALSGAYDGSVRLWDLESGQQIRQLKGHSDWVVSLAFAPGGERALTGSKDGLLIYWDLESGDPILQMSSDPNSNWSLAISPDGRTALSDAAQGSAIYWDLESGAEIRRLFRSDSTEGYGASGLAFLPDGQSAISGENDGAVIQWDLKTGQGTAPLWEARRHPHPGGDQPGWQADAHLRNERRAAPVGSGKRRAGA